MTKCLCSALLLFCNFVVGAAEKSPYQWREAYYKDMPIDHFAKNGKTFDLRYLINDNWWDSNGGPILFYAGNEGEVEDFAQNTGIMWDWAPQFRALLLFAEHRYYGKSLPYGKSSSQNLGQLSADQAMADYADLIDWFKRTTKGAKTSPVIAIGGSYGAMLAAWMRLKYPNTIAGAVASSAPILQLTGGSAPCSSFSSGATRAFSVSTPSCEKAVNRSWQLLTERTKTDKGIKWINDKFKVCSKTLIKAGEGAEYDLLGTVSNAWRYMAMFNYPYPANLLTPLPEWPVKQACKYLTNSNGKDDDQFLLNVRDAALIFYNYTGQAPCFNLNPSSVGKVDTNLWSYQCCAELTFTKCQEASDMFRPVKWSESDYSTRCIKQYKVTPNFTYLTKTYGVDKLKKATNIIFTSGDLDPWAGSSPTKESLAGADPSVVVINIKNAAHHYDLRPSSPKDTPEVTKARDQMKTIVKGWIDAAKKAG